MRSAWLGFATAVALGAGRPDLRALRRSEICPTLGDIQETTAGRLAVNAAKTRAVAPGAGRGSAELDFRYLGPTEETSRLASGQVRRQLGLKLKAADGCNLLYVMWRIDPEPGIVVQVKRNPGARTSHDCGARGYHRLKAERSTPVPAVELGSSHRLRAALAADRLVVEVDGIVAWTGLLDADAMTLAGPVGLRTDNVRLDLAFRAEPGSAASPCATVAPGAESD